MQHQIILVLNLINIRRVAYGVSEDKEIDIGNIEEVCIDNIVKLVIDRLYKEYKIS